MAKPVEAIVVTNPDLANPPKSGFWFKDDMFPLDDEGLPVPRFSVQEVSKVFFGHKPDWLRWRERGDRSNPKGYFLLKGKPLKFQRTPKNARYYTLADIERMTYALAETGVFDGMKVQAVVVMLKNCAKIYGVKGI